MKDYEELERELEKKERKTKKGKMKVSGKSVFGLKKILEKKLKKNK